MNKPRLLLVIALLTIPSTLSAQPPVILHYISAMEAVNAGDLKGYIGNMGLALSEEPGHSILLRHLAQGYCLSQEPAIAADYLVQVANTGAWFDIAAMLEFEKCVQDEAFAQAMALVAKNKDPFGSVEIELKVADRLLIPEGITYDPGDDAFYLGSIPQHKIIRVDRNGATSDFTAPDLEGFYSGLGMKIDARRRHLWAASAVFESMEGYREDIAGRSSLSCFRLDDGERIRHFELGGGELEHNLNDLEIDSEGRIFVTDSIGGSILVLDPGADSLRTLVDIDRLNGPNGLALDEARGRLYVSQYNLGITVVDVTSGEFNSLVHPPDAALYGIDGLYLHDGSLIAVQNHPSLDRIARFRLNDAGNAVVAADVLVRRHPQFDEPTTGTIVGDQFYFIGNSQIERFLGMDAPVSAEDLDEVQIMRLTLDD